MSVRKKKRLVICSSPNGRGIEKYAKYISGLLRGSLITCEGMDKGFVLWEFLGILRYTRDIIGAEQVVFTNTRVSPLLWVILDWRRVAVVVHDLMDTDGEILRGSGLISNTSAGIRKRVIRKVNSWMVKKSIEQASGVIFNSKYTESEVRRWLGKECARTCVLSPPPSFEKLVMERRHILKQKKEARELVKVLAVTGTSDNKSHEEYMTFHTELESRLGRRVEIIMYGIDLSKTRDEFRKWVANKKDRVRVKYRRSEVELIKDYLDCDFVISLSREEGYGMPVADALGFGIPVVARSIVSYREIKMSLDSSELMCLADDVSHCVVKAADLMSGRIVGSDRDERLEAYTYFCMKQRRRAKSALMGIAEGNSK